MKIIDITLPLSTRSLHWPTDTPMRLWRTSQITKGAQSNDTRIEMSLHSGTHYDAPLHFLKNGKSLDKIPLNVFCGSVYVAHFPNIKKITAANLEKLRMPKGVSRILFRTSNSANWSVKNAPFRENYVGLSSDAAEWLARKKFNLVGIDYLSVAQYDEIKPVHDMLLKSNIAILEGLDLRKAMKGIYQLIALPLLIPGTEAAPARAILLKS